MMKIKIFFKLLNLFSEMCLEKALTIYSSLESKTCPLRYLEAETGTLS